MAVLVLRVYLVSSLVSSSFCSNVTFPFCYLLVFSEGLDWHPCSFPWGEIYNKHEASVSARNNESVSPLATCGILIKVGS